MLIHSIAIRLTDQLHWPLNVNMKAFQTLSLKLSLFAAVVYQCIILQV